MTRSLLTVLLLLAVLPQAAGAEAPAEYAGAYGGDLVWSGTVTMAGDVLILPGGKLTVRPGTEVRVVPAEGTQIDPEYFSSLTELLVRGTLEVEGTAQQPVRFVVVDRPEPEAIAWAGITFDAAAGAVRHAVIERAETAVRCVASAPELVGNRLLRCRYGVIAQAGSHPQILDNVIEDGEGGVFCWRGSNPTLQGNRISGLDEEGVFVDATSRPRLVRNVMTGNAIGLALAPRDLPFDSTLVRDNLENVRYLAGPDAGRRQP